MLLGLFSLVTIWMHGLIGTCAAPLQPAAGRLVWQARTDLQRRHRRRPPLCPPDLSMSRHGTESVEIPAGLLRKFTETLCYAA